MKKYNPILFSLTVTIVSWIVYGVGCLLFNDMVEEYDWNINVMLFFTAYFLLFPVIAMGSFLYMAWLNREWSLKFKIEVIVLIIIGTILSILYWILLSRMLPLE